jgi:hypothetical protein
VRTSPARVHHNHVGERERPAIEADQDYIIPANCNPKPPIETMQIRRRKNLQVFDLREKRTTSDERLIRMPRLSPLNAVQHIVTAKRGVKMVRAAREQIKMGDGRTKWSDNARRLLSAG